MNVVQEAGLRSSLCDTFWSDSEEVTHWACNPHYTEGNVQMFVQMM